MKTEKNNLQKLVLKNGTFSGGFASLDASQLDKIKGGSVPGSGNNCNCTNTGSAKCN